MYKAICIVIILILLFYCYHTDRYYRTQLNSRMYWSQWVATVQDYLIHVANESPATNAFAGNAQHVSGNVAAYTVRAAGNSNKMDALNGALNMLVASLAAYVRSLKAGPEQSKALVTSSAVALADILHATNKKCSLTYLREACLALADRLTSEMGYYVAGKYEIASGSMRGSIIFGNNVADALKLGALY